MANNIYPFKIKNRLMTYETASRFRVGTDY